MNVTAVDRSHDHTGCLRLPEGEVLPGNLRVACWKSLLKWDCWPDCDVLGVEVSYTGQVHQGVVAWDTMWIRFLETFRYTNKILTQNKLKIFLEFLLLTLWFCFWASFYKGGVFNIYFRGNERLAAKFPTTKFQKSWRDVYKQKSFQIKMFRSNKVSTQRSSQVLTLKYKFRI